MPTVIVVDVTPEDFESDHPLPELYSRENWKRQLTKQEKENPGTEIRGDFTGSATGKEKERLMQRSGIRGMSQAAKGAYEETDLAGFFRQRSVARWWTDGRF